MFNIKEKRVNAKTPNWIDELSESEMEELVSAWGEEVVWKNYMALHKLACEEYVHTHTKEEIKADREARYRRQDEIHERLKERTSLKPISSYGIGISH